MALITVDILKKDNPELYEYMKDYLNDTDTPEFIDRFIRAIDVEKYLEDKGFNASDPKNFKYYDAHILTPEQDDAYKNCWSSKY